MYSRRFSKKHRINAVLGTTYDVRHKLFTRAEFTDFSTFQFGYTDPSFAANTPFPLQKRRFKEELISFLGRGTYTLKVIWLEIIMEATYPPRKLRGCRCHWP